VEEVPSKIAGKTRESGPTEGNGILGGPEGPPRVLVVEDEELVRRTLRRILEEQGLQVQEAGNGAEALTVLHDGLDVILLDVQMPEMDGFEFLKRLRAHQRFSELPVVMVTGLDGRADRLKAAEHGASDFIGKPFEVGEVRVRVGAQLRLKRGSDRLKRQSEILEEEVKKRTAALRGALRREKEARQELQEAHLDTIRRLVLAAELRDGRTAEHIARIGDYCTVLGKGLGMEGEDLAQVAPACSLHDIGKIGMPDAILTKPGPLTMEERAIMEEHTLVGARILNGASAPILRLGSRVALTHHERWDGTGYPMGLKGKEIPLLGRICAVADVFDALTTDRLYRRAVSNEEAYAYMRRAAGLDLDPQIVEVFFEDLPEIEMAQKANPDGSTGGMHVLHRRLFSD
jgi:putative two-component system response regulator